MPVLARMVPAPLAVEIRPGALADLPAVLSDRRISTSGRVAVAVSATSGAAVEAYLRERLGAADFFAVGSGRVESAHRLADEIRASRYDAVVGVGGGKVLDVTKYAAARLGLPMVSVAANLAHDGLGSPVAVLDNEAGRGSYGVPAPLAVVVDLDLVRSAPARTLRAGVGEALSNLSAVRDWRLSHAVN
ncbi:iron-containing alcohol dehydrogenase, partial [Motilibacter deserti]|nr:iron-containing alcohol dehydrogenase family protein [Motilibacter deserti]